MRLAENTERKKSPKIRHQCTIAQLCQSSRCTPQLRHVSTIEKNVKLHMCHNMVNFGPLAAEIGLPARLGHPCKFQQVSFVGFVTAAMSLTRGRPNFARCLAVSWAGTLCIHFWSSCPLREFCQVQNSLCLQVLSCPILALEYWT